MRSTFPTTGTPLGRRLSLAGVLRPHRPSEIWFKPALSAVVAAAPPNLLLLALGRLDLAMYTMAGSLCALYAHHRPYAARARALARVVLGMLAGLAVALVTAALTRDAVVLVAVGALLAAAQRAVCDATRVGPPGHVIPTFVSSAALFLPQTPAGIPGHLALTAGAGAWAWLVCMAPGLIRPHGPERRATAQALNAAAAYAATGGTGDGHAEARAAGYTAVQAAWHSLPAGSGSGARATTRRSLARLLARAEVALAAPADTDPGALRAAARALRGGGRLLPAGVRDTVEGGPPGAWADEGAGADEGAASIAPPAPPRPRLGPLVPLAARTALGCALAGYGSLALGIGRPYWALVTAAALYQANLTLTWSRTVQRVVGNLAGVLLFAAIAPLVHLGQLPLVLFCLALAFGAEALMSRNYWLGTVCVTPMALLITEFAGRQESGALIAERIVDTLVGALLGLLAAVVVTDRRSGDRVERALATADRAREHAARLLAEPAAAPAALDTARRALATALTDLRAAADASAGEWRQRAVPEERVVLAERSGHRTLAATVRRRAARPDRGTRTEDVRS
ncbi:FUSC family protein [Streptomyces sp. SID8352]|uniref:FUSC family protein n=1 Tax=Streptomyces sp. SID8352 TaxID=2690338 RepID=UPI00137002EA|nr:FUSC family protein [Streptomyces sp. SID8352]MYU23315.1 FUSC family protein [Streptomyces sp. SID8352]